LSIQGDIAIDVDPGAFRARSSWAIKSVRGSMRSLELRLDPDDEVLEVTLDGQSIPAGIERDGAERRLSIPLTEPLRPGVPPKRLSMTTQRKLPPQSSARLSFHGFPLSNAKEQFGAIGIAQSGNLVISPTVGRGLRRIDPRTELTDDLRARPTWTFGSSLRPLWSTLMRARRSAWEPGKRRSTRGWASRRPTAGFST
jgi:hypothetical protein